MPVDPVIVRSRIQLLVGVAATTDDPEARYFNQLCGEVDSLDSISYEYLNKLLIAAGFSRVGRGFIEFFQAMDTPLSTFDERLTRWRQLAMLNFGSFRSAFSDLCSADRDAIERRLVWKPLDLDTRALSRSAIHVIDRRDTPLLGYISAQAARELVAKRDGGIAITPADDDVIRRLHEAESRGLHNTYEYLTAPYIDAYVATSMRSGEDFYSVHRFLEALFDQSDPTVSQLSHFDPTQSHHPDRIVKGIIEGLMLKRARFTIYLAQESDTLGKDSELATTLAQGKPVIVFVPDLDREPLFNREVIRADLEDAAANDPTSSTGTKPHFNRLASRFAELFPPQWSGLGLNGGITTDDEFEQALTAFIAALKARYDRRAATLREEHPLALQVSLQTGVANGILLARTVDECRELVKDIVKANLEFNIVARDQGSTNDVPDLEAPFGWARYLRERRTNSVFRVVVSDRLVTNAFWNWYLTDN